MKRFLFYLFFLDSKVTVVDSYDELKEELSRCVNKDKKVLVVIDLLDIGIQFKNVWMRIENRSYVNSELKRMLVDGYKIRACKKEWQKEGFEEIDEFLRLYDFLSGVDVLLITDQFFYVPEHEFLALDLSYDSYKKGVLFFRGKLWLQVLEDISKNYSEIVFISSSKTRIAAAKAFGARSLILFCNKRLPLYGLSV